MDRDTPALILSRGHAARTHERATAKDPARSSLTCSPVVHLRRSSARPSITSSRDDVVPQGLISVLEVEPSGHRLHYLRHLVEAAGPHRCVILTSDDAARSEEYATHTAELDARTVVLPSGGPRRAVLDSAVEQAISVGSSRLIIPDGDLYLLPVLELMVRRPRLPLEIRILLMRTATVGGPGPLRPATIVKPVLVQLLRPFRQVQVLFLTDALGVVTRRRGFVGVRGLRDPVLRTEEAANERPEWFPPTDPDTTLVGVFGVISVRKNLPLLVEALASMPDVVLLVGGRVDPDVATFLDSDDVRTLIAAGRVVVVNRLLSSAEFGAALAWVDIAAVLHDNDAPSGILAEACIRNTPVVVPAGGWLARVGESTGIGVPTALTGPAVADAIRRLAGDLDVYVEAARRHAPLIDTTHFTGGLLGP